MPHASVFTTIVRRCDVCERTAPAPRERVVKCALAPRAGAENVTNAPATGFFSASVTVTASPIAKRPPIIVDWLAPTPTVSLAGSPARFARAKLAGVASSEPPEPEPPEPEPPEPALPEGPPPAACATLAPAAYEPAMLFALNSGDVATPLALVVALASAPAPMKLAPAPEAAAHAPAPVLELSVNVTVAPATGLPSASSTFTRSGWG